MRILAIHHSSELYGSDRSFVECCRILSARYGRSNIDIWLPEYGDLGSLLEPLCDRLIIQSQVKLTRADIASLGLRKLVTAYARREKLQRLMQDYQYIYVNTIVILDVLIALRGLNCSTVVHIREIPGRFARIYFSALLLYSGANFIFNSNATMLSFHFGLRKRGRVVLNGLSFPSQSLPVIRQRAAPILRGHSRVLVIGRINSWKGQQLVLSAFEGMSDKQRSLFSLRIVGSVAPGCEYVFRDLKDRIEGLHGTLIAEILDHVSDTSELYRWADIVVVPSIRPEPFGLVAVEAMAFGCVVVAAGHGGLMEIVSDRRTGFLFAPGDADSLKETLLSIGSSADSSDILQEIRVRAFKDYEQRFGSERLARELIIAIEAFGSNR